MAQEADPADRIATGQPTVNTTTVVVGPVRLERSAVDIRGARRLTPQFLLSADVSDGEARWPPLDAAALAEVIAGVQPNEIYIRWPRRCRAQLEPVLRTLESSGLRRDDNWPVLSDPDAKGDELTLRVSRPQSELDPSRYPAHGLIPHSPVAEDYRRLIADIQSEIERAASNAILGSSFDARYGVVRIMTVGSTSRGTYAAFPADFDLVVHTERERTGIAHTDVEAVCGKLIESVTQTRAFESFVAAVAQSVGARPHDFPSVELQFLGARGPQSLVARYNLVWRNTATDNPIAFLDITFGKLPQLIGYETWFRRLLENLGPLWAERLRSEIRTAKIVLKRLGGLYGSAERGLRAHTVEQWIIQSFNYRASGIPVGTLENALRLIIEEGTASAHAGAAVPIRFEDYKARFPLWHPGWWESDAGIAIDRRNVNLWDLLGDGEGAAAEHKWQKLLALALVYAGDKTHREACDVEDLARSTEVMLGLLKDTHRSLGD